MSALSYDQGDIWSRLPPAATSDYGVRQDIATLLRFQNDADAFNPMYLFWDLYQPTVKDSDGERSCASRLSEQGRRAVLEVLDLLYRRHRIGYYPDSGDSDMRAFLEAHEDGPPYDMEFPDVFKNALVFIHVTAARAVMLHQTDGFSEEVRACLAEVERTLDRLYRAGFDHKTRLREWGPTRLEGIAVYHSTLAVSAICFVHLSRICRTEGRYGDGLHYLARAGDLYEYALPTPMGMVEWWPLGRDRPKLDSVWAGHNVVGGDFEHFLTGLRIPLAELTDMLDLLKVNRHSLSNWRAVVDDCRSMAAHSCSWRFDEIEEADRDEYFYKHGVELGDLEELEQVEGSVELLAAHIERARIPDHNGDLLKWDQFWHGAQVWAIEQRSPSEYRELREDDEKYAAERRLRGYFFGDSWPSLPKLAQERLINADVNWISTQRMSREAILNDLLRATEEICYWFLPKLLDKAHHQFRDSLDASHVRDFVRICEQGIFRDDLDEREVKFLTGELPASMRQLTDARNRAEHDRAEPASRESVEPAYRLFLGLGRKGILPELARIKCKARVQVL